MARARKITATDHTPASGKFNLKNKQEAEKAKDRETEACPLGKEYPFTFIKASFGRTTLNILFKTKVINKVAKKDASKKAVSK